MLSPVKWNNKLYVDGALLDGFPIHLYDKSTTLGIRLKNAKDTFEKFDNILVYAQAVCTALYHELVKFKERYIADYFVAEIFIPNNKTYNMSCTSEDKLEMYNIGYESTKIKLEKMIKKNDDIKSI
jgi:predicted acylesterase/phospholipase RssA